jgi:hypothetical protein
MKDIYDLAQQKALSLGASSFGLSSVKNKRYFVIYGGRRINFGLRGANTYLDGAPIEKRNSFRARHKAILLKNGKPAYKDKNQPAYWAYHVLW